MNAERDRELRKARTHIARRLHPDVGGDPAEYLAALEALEAPMASAPVVAHSSRGAFRTGMRRISRRLRRRKYIDITPS